MARLKITFPNLQGNLLAGLLEIPDTHTRAYALFAHCFTCSRDSTTASRISRALNAREGMVDSIEKNIKIEGDLTAEQKDRLMEIADRCPVHRSLMNEILIHSTLA